MTPPNPKWKKKRTLTDIRQNMHFANLVRRNSALTLLSKTILGSALGSWNGESWSLTPVGLIHN